MGKKRGVGNYPLELRKKAVERLKSCDNVMALAKELGIPRRSLYRWQDQLEPIDSGVLPPENVKERDLRIQLATAKRLLADKALEVDFFKGALQKVEARRQSNTQPGETASTTKSGS